MTAETTASGAVSQRRMRGPRPTVFAPAFAAISASSAAKPPSAPVMMAIFSFSPSAVSVEPGYPSAAEPTVDVTLLVGYPKQDKLEQVIRHGVELGCDHFIPFFSRYCVAAPKKEEQKNERYNRIAFEAAKHRTCRWPCRTDRPRGRSAYRPRR